MSPDTLSLAGKTAIVTGSGKENGIGAAIARALARNGSNVAMHYVSQGSKIRAENLAESIRREYGTKVTVLQGEVKDEEVARGMIKQVMEELGVERVDVLVNNAATASNNSLLAATKPQLEHEFAVNVFGPVYLIQAVVDVGRMPKGGRIINIGSIASKLLIGPGVYGMTKAAMDAMTTFAAAELGKTHGITVNRVAPGGTPTDMSKDYLLNADGTPSEMATALWAQTRAADRLGSTEDVADAVLLLVQERSRWITAQWIDVGGGVTGTM